MRSGFSRTTSSGQRRQPVAITVGETIDHVESIFDVAKAPRENSLQNRLKIEPCPLTAPR